MIARIACCGSITGRSAALTQATQFLGPVSGPAVGAIIAVHSVTAFADVAILVIAGGVLMSATAIWPALKREMSPESGRHEGRLLVRLKGAGQTGI